MQVLTAKAVLRGIEIEETLGFGGPYRGMPHVGAVGYGGAGRSWFRGLPEVMIMNSAAVQEF